MNSEICKTSNPHYNQTYWKKRDEKRAALSNLSVYYTWKNIKSSYKATNLK